MPLNLDYETPDVVVLGDEGNMAWNLFDGRDGRFYTTNLGCPDEHFEEYDTFEEMVVGVMKQQQVL